MRRTPKLAPGVRAAVDCALLVLGLLLSGALPAQEVRDDIEIVCPCRIESSGTDIAATLGVRSFRGSESAELGLSVIAFDTVNTENFDEVASATLGITVDAIGALAARDFTLEWEPQRPSGSRALAIFLVEIEAYGTAILDVVLMENEVDVSGSFSVRNLDLLTDTDGDGVSDLNEGSEGTDPRDAGSRPGPSTIDLLALHGEGFAELYDGDAATRIHHVIAVANGIYRDSSTGIRLRVVGIDEVNMDNEGRDGGILLEELATSDQVRRLREAHGADLVMMFSHLPPTAGLCGIAYLGGVLSDMRTRGLLSPDAAFSVVYGNCSGDTAAHEIGHNLGLGHSLAQSSLGTFRWSRGHYIDLQQALVDQFAATGTVMTYGRRFTDRFSDPGRNCSGSPCGKDRNLFDGADAVTSLNAVRFQAADFLASSFDSDGDGLSDDLDPDDDNDGVVDDDDAFPLDPAESVDSDGDGVGDNADEFPHDPAESRDSDGDGVGDNADAFPFDPAETADSDGDAVGDNADMFPNDPTESVDSDGDGVGDNSDDLPMDPSETEDSDGDGIGNNADADDDNDGVPDPDDAFPTDAAEWADSDGDGVGDNWDLLPNDPAQVDLTASYRFIGEGSDDRIGDVLSASDFDGDGRSDIVIGAPGHDALGLRDIGAVYLIAAADLPDLDAADGSTDQVIGLRHVAAGANSWKLLGEERWDEAGRSLAVGDFDGDGRDDFVIGAASHSPFVWGNEGAAYLVASVDLPVADAADGAEDGIVALGRIGAQPNSWKLIGANEFDEAGSAVGIVSDLDGDGRSEVSVGARGFDANEADGIIDAILTWLFGGSQGAVYVVASSDLAVADAADGVAGGRVDLANVISQSNSWRLVGEDESDEVGNRIASVRDLDGDGLAELLLGAPDHDADGRSGSGAIYLVSAGGLAEADAADGDADRSIDLGRIAPLHGNWKFIGPRWSNLGKSLASAGDLNGDAVDDLIVGGDAYDSAYIVSGANLELLDNADETADGVIDLDGGLSPPHGWEADSLSVSPAGDVDADGLADLLIGETYPEKSWLLGGAALTKMPAVIGDGELDEHAGIWQFDDGGSEGLAPGGDIDADGFADILFGDTSGYNEPGVVHAVLAADLAVLDESDGTADRTIAFHNIAGDTDGDGVRNIVDRDDDGDGRLDSDDRNPLDNDDRGATKRDDDDGDGVADVRDVFPRDPAEWTDADADGTGDNADPDDDNDGVPDADDAFPRDPTEWADADGDGVGDNADPDDDNDGVEDSADSDDDNDGVADAVDHFPLNPRESADSDGDGVGDNWDLAPNDPSQVDITASYRFLGDETNDQVGEVLTAGDFDGDGRSDVVIGAPHHDALGLYDLGAVYVIAAADLAAIDTVDGSADQTINLRHAASGDNSWQLLGEERWDEAGGSLAAADLDGDGRDDLIIGADSHSPTGRTNAGAVYLLASADLAAADAADGAADGVVGLGRVATQSNSWQLVGQNNYDNAGTSVAALGDLDGDGRPEVAVAARRYDAGDGATAQSDAGAVWIVASGDLAPADAADGSTDSRVDLQNVALQPNSWRFVGEARSDEAGSTLASLSDIDGDGLGEMLVGAPDHDADGAFSTGAVYLLSGGNLAEADAADGETDGAIDLGQVAALTGNWKFIGPRYADLGESLLGAGDLNDDDVDELIAGGSASDSAYIVSGADLGSLDGADGTADGVIDLDHGLSPPNGWEAESLGVSSAGDVDGDGLSDVLFRDTYPEASYLVHGADLDGLPGTIDSDDLHDHAGVWRFDDDGSDALVPAGDVDGDGLADVLFGNAGGYNEPAAVHLLLATDLAVLDEADGMVDQTVALHNVAGDTDGDGVRNIADPDDDGDGVADQDDSRPLVNSNGSSGDHDEDGDGVADAQDIFPSDPGEWADADADGTGDNADPDDDNDGTADADDAFPRDPTEQSDADGDGVGDNADPDDDNDGVEDSADFDDDNDGVADDDDLFPLDPNEWADSDGDGVGDNWDLLPHDASGADITSSYRFVGEDSGDDIGEVLSAGDFDGDGLSDIVIGVPDHDAFGMTNAGGVYLIAAADLEALDAADGSADQVIGLNHAASGRNSWKLIGEDEYSVAGRSLTVTDLDSDGGADLVVGAQSRSPNQSWSRVYAVYLVSSADLTAADAADGVMDSIVNLGRVSAQPGSWKLIEENDYDYAGTSVAALGDLDGDGRPEVVIGSPGYDVRDGETTRSNAGAVHIAASGDLAAADAVDGSTDGGIDLENVASQPNSWKLLGEARSDEAGTSLAAVSDHDGDGLGEMLVGAPDHDADDEPATGAVYLLSGGNLAEADAADGETDGAIDLGQVAALTGNWKFIGPRYANLGESLFGADDLNGDDVDDLIVGGDSSDSAYIVSGAALGALDGADGTADGVIDLEHGLSPPNGWEAESLSASFAGDVDGDGFGDVLFGDTYPEASYLVHGADLGGLPGTIDSDDLDERTAVWRFDDDGSDALVPAGDVDGDGLADVLFGNVGSYNEPAAVHLLLATDLAVLDEADGRPDRAIAFHNVAGDTDGDGVRNITDPDDDGDGVIDSCDIDPLDPDQLVHWSLAGSDACYVDLSTASLMLSEVAFDDTRSPGSKTIDHRGDGNSNRGMVKKGSDRAGLRGVDVHGLDGAEPRNTGFQSPSGDGFTDSNPPSHLPSAGADPVYLTDPVTTSSTPRRSALPPVFPGLASYRLQPEHVGTGSSATTVWSAGDIDGDGLNDMVVAVTSDNGGLLYFMSGIALPAADMADGASDGSINLAHSPSVPGAWRIAGLDGSLAALRHVGSASDHNGDGLGELIIGTAGPRGANYLVSAANLPLADRLDGAEDGRIAMNRLVTMPDSGELVSRYGGADWAIAPMPDAGVTVLENPTVTVAGTLGDGVLRDAWTGSFAAIMPRGLALDAHQEIVMEPHFVADSDRSWAFIVDALSAPHSSMATAGDFDGDGRADVIIGLPQATTGSPGPGAVYLLPVATLPSADGADGELDGRIGLAAAPALPGAWKLVGEAVGNEAGASVSFGGDFDRDGLADILIGAPGADAAGAVYLVAGADLAAADAADGTVDSAIDLRMAASQPSSWKFLAEAGGWRAGHTVSFAGDVNGDGIVDLAIGATSFGTQAGSAYLLSGRGLRRADAADGLVDGIVYLGLAASVDDSWKILGESDGWGWRSLHPRGAGDVDGDGLGDLILAPAARKGYGAGDAWMLSGADLPWLDRADGSADGIINLGQLQL